MFTSDKMFYFIFIFFPSFWDFNALYLFSQDQDLPLGPGVLWENQSHTYSKKPMVQGVSRGQLEWLMWLQNESICVDENGVRRTIQHALNYGEHQVNGKPVDGFMMKNGQPVYFEYYGCYFHPGCCIPDEQIFNAEERRRADTEKFNDLRQQGKRLLSTIYLPI